MAIEIVSSEFLLFCKTLGADFSSTAMLGHQALYVDRRDLYPLLKKASIPCDDERLNFILGDTSLRELRYGFADNLFHALGAITVESIDASDYEGASIVHDMNLPISPELRGRFTTLFDGGTLEHVFNFPTAIENCMRLLKKGGSFISVAPANNYFGHGFYQFSSELFFRVFCEQNGFRIEKVFLTAEKPFGSWYEIPDPASLRERVALTNQVPTAQLFLATKITDDAALHVMPQQSDYNEILWAGENKEAWTAHGDSRLDRKLRINRALTAILPAGWASFLRASRSLVRGAIKPPFSHPKLRKFRP